jgi:hypothetical protein
MTSREDVAKLKLRLGSFSKDELIEELIGALFKVAAPPANLGAEWIDQNHQIDRYGVALMIIREGCSDPSGLARRILSEFDAVN